MALVARWTQHLVSTLLLVADRHIPMTCFWTLASRALPDAEGKEGSSFAHHHMGLTMLFKVTQCLNHHAFCRLP
jgi:hypothetical protein